MILVPTLRVGTHWPGHPLCGSALRRSPPVDPYSRAPLTRAHKGRSSAQEQNDAERQNRAFPRRAWERVNPEARSRDVAPTRLELSDLRGAGFVDELLQPLHVWRAAGAARVSNV